MSKVIEVNTETGEVTEREMTQEELAVFVVESEPTMVVEQTPLEKLQAFLQANPDVAALIQ